MSPDPYGQFASPYLGMGNLPQSQIDRDGGSSGCPPPLICDDSNDSPWGLSPSTSGEPQLFGSYEIFTDIPIQLSTLIAKAGQALPVSTPPPSPLRVVPKSPTPKVNPIPWGAFFTRITLLGSMTLLHGDKSPDTRIQPKAEHQNNHDENQFITLYRGVHAGHPDFKNAIKGSAYPAIIGSPFDIDLQQGGGSALSGTTSWSMSLNVANYHANKPHPKTGISGGIVLKKQFKLNEVIPGEDIFPELKYLVPRVVHGAETFTPTGPGSPYAY